MSGRPSTTVPPRIDPLRLDELSPGDANDLANGVDVELMRFPEMTLPDLPLKGASLTGSHLLGVSAARADLTGSRLVDVQVERLNIPDVRATRSHWTGVVVTGRVGSFQALEATWRSVRFVGCKIGLVNLRNAALVDVELVDCVVDELDLTHAKLRRVRLHDTRVERLNLQHATLQDVDLRGATIGAVDSVTHLRGATFSSWQISDFAPVMAREMGIRSEG